MKAAQLTAYGGQDVIKTQEASKPSAGTGEVLVQVHASSVNPFDWKMRDGMMKDAIPLELPAILGSDVAGTVAEIGEGVTGFEAGQAVYGMAGGASGQGAYAEFTPVKATQLVAKPTSVDFMAAAALPLVGASAYQALVDHMALQSGQKILIHGGAGGIGSIAIQLAHHLGAHVATTASPSDTDYVKGLGADEVIDYTTQDFAELVHDYDAVFDTIGGETNSKSYGVLKPGGTLVSMVQPADDARVKQASIIYVQQSSKPTVERLTELAKLVDSGAIKVHVDKVFPLDEAAAALEHLKTGHPAGKVVIQVV